MAIYKHQPTPHERQKIANWCDPINGYNILHYAAIKGDQQLLSQAITEFRVPVDSTTKTTGDTALHLAVKSSNFHLVEELIRHKRANHRIRNHLGFKPADVLKQ